MERREFLRTVLAGAAVSAAPHWTFAADAPPAGGKPNVLFVAIDDLNDWVGCLGGHPDVKTPNLDKLAKRATLFTHSYCSAPACGPSRASLMTGISPARSGVYVNKQNSWRNPMMAKATTLPQHFMAAGYESLGSGKIYHGPHAHPASWDEYWPSKTVSRPVDPRPPKRPWGGGKAARSHFDWGPLNVPAEKMGDMQVADWVIGQLNATHAKPFFLACGFYRPHLPWYVPKRFFDLYPLESVTLPNAKADDLDDVPPAGVAMAKPDGDHKRVVDADQWRKAVQGYLASISFADHCVGRVIDALDKSPHADNTLIVLWSDHGWHLGEKLHWRKFALWEEATHNIILFAGRGIKPQRCDTPVTLLDIYPTLIDLCGLPKRADLDGMSLAPLLANPSAAWPRPALTTEGHKNHSLRTKRWRYIRYADGSAELYDHSNDELEWTNLAGKPEYAEVIASLAKWLPKTDAPPNPSIRRKKPKAGKK